MAIRYVDVEPGDGKAKPAKAPPQPAFKPASDPAPTPPPADEAPAPAAKAKRRRK